MRKHARSWPCMSWEVHDACTSPRTPTLQTNYSWHGGILPRLVWVPTLGAKPIAHLLWDTIYHSTKVIYNTSEIPRIRLRSTARASRNITIRTLSKSSVSITVTYQPLRTILVFLPQNYPTTSTNIPVFKVLFRHSIHCYSPNNLYE